MRRDLLLVDDPVERIRRSISRIGGEIDGLDLETLLRPLDHCLGCTNLCLANRTAGFDIHDDAHLDVHQIIVRISEESWPSHRAGPLRGWIRRGGKLRRLLRQKTHRRGLPNTPSWRGWRPEDRALYSTPSQGLIAAYWRPQRSDSHRLRTLHRPPVQPQYRPQQRAQTPAGTYRCRGIAHDGHVRMPSDPGFCRQSRARKTSDRRGSPVRHGISLAPSELRIRSR